jgi:hypothetical protein
MRPTISNFWRFQDLQTHQSATYATVARQVGARLGSVVIG